MRKMITTIAAAMMLLTASLVQAEITIGAAQNDEKNLYQVFNDYFDYEGYEPYTSNTVLFSDLGGNTGSQWKTAAGSTILSAYRVAERDHTLSVSSNGEQKVLDTFKNPWSGWRTFENGSLGNSSALDFQLRVDLPPYPKADPYYYEFSSDPGENSSENVIGRNTFNPVNMLDAENVMGDGRDHMIALDITDLYNSQNGTTYDNVYMFGWEDNYGNDTDWDYQDLMFVVTNISPIGDGVDGDLDGNASPEPATLALMGLGLAGLGLTRSRRRK